MNGNWAQLIRILLNSQNTVAGKRLASEIGVSTRTIRSYVRGINALNNHRIIGSLNSGYCIVDRLAAINVIQLHSDAECRIPQNDNERYTYIVKILLRNQQVDSYDLANELYISYATLRRIILYINDRLERWHTTVLIQSDKLTLDGDESSERRLFSHLIYRENTGNLLSIDYLKGSFGKQMTLDVQTSVDMVIHDFNLNFNEFAYNNLLLHLLILVSRLSEGNTVTHNNLTGSSQVGDYTKSLAKHIQTRNHTSISHSEIQEIDVLLKSNANLSESPGAKRFYDKQFNRRLDLIIK